MLNLILHSDIDSKAVQDRLCVELSRYPKHLFLTSTMILKAIRDKTICDKNSDRLLSFTEFERALKPVIFKNNDCLSNTEQRYLLSLVIREMYADDDAIYNTINAVRKELYELFSTMQFSGATITAEAIKAIANNYSIAESAIFELYQRYILVVDDIVSISNGRMPSGQTSEIIGSLPINTGKPLFTYQEKKKSAIRESISTIEALFIDGFLFFDEIQKYTIRCAVELGKEVFVISKQFSDGSGAFIVDDTVKNLANEIGCKVNIALSGTTPGNQNTALGFAKKSYPGKLEISQDIPSLADGSIRFIEPFINRDAELRYVVKEISDRIRRNYNGTLESITSLLSDMAIIVAVSKEKYEQRISDLFAEVGAFVRKERLPAEIAKETLPIVCFTKSEFLSANIKNLAGKELSLSQKIKAFERCYHKIEINKHKRPISTYPIGQFVLRIYEIATEGMSLEAFKCIMFSNWRYSLNISNQKWSDFINEFRLLEIWFEKHTDIAMWRQIAEKLLEHKSQIADNPLYCYHPLNAVSTECLCVLIDLIRELESITNTIKTTSGRISEHISVLQNIVMKKEDFVATDDPDQEQMVVERLINTVSALNDNTLLSNISATYFAENIRTMLQEYDEEAIDEGSPLSLAVVNLENMRTYKTCYFIMCEAGKYPRPYIEKFPYTADICDILSKEEYGINAVPSNRFGLQYHLRLERYLLKNVLDFTSDELVITYTEKESGNSNSLSLFAKNIAALFCTEIPFESSKQENQEVLVSTENIPNPIFLPLKANYTITELAIFKLCPRMYYHRQIEEKSCFTTRLQLRFYAEAVMYCDLLRRFMDYNLQNRAVYSDRENRYVAVIDSLHQECVNENKAFFDFLSTYELLDISRNVRNKLLASVESSKKYIKGHSFTLISYKDAVYSGDGYTVTVAHDNRFVDYETKSWRMSQSTSYIEFLVMKTDDRKSKLVHYRDMVEALDREDPNEDRINLTSRIIAKINIQFDSKRFIADGIKRTDALVEEVTQYDFANAPAILSSYCPYCKYGESCLGR